MYNLCINTFSRNLILNPKITLSSGRILKQGYLEISASALTLASASASAFQCKYSFLHSINNL